MRVQAGEASVVVAGVAVVASDAQRLGERRVVRRDEPAFTGDERLGGREAEDLGGAERAERNAIGRRAERVGGVEDDRDAVLARDVLDAPGIARGAEDVSRQDRARAFEGGGRVRGVDLERVGQALDEAGCETVPGDRVRRRRRT